MPNPLTLELSSRAQIHVGRNSGKTQQRLTFESPDTEFVWEVGGKGAMDGKGIKFILHLDSGVWTIKHEWALPAQVQVWEKGEGKELDSVTLAFDDGAKDKDFDDIRVRAYFTYNAPPADVSYPIPGTFTVLKGNPNFQF